MLPVIILLYFFYQFEEKSLISKFTVSLGKFYNLFIQFLILYNNKSENKLNLYFRKKKTIDTYVYLFKRDTFYRKIKYRKNNVHFKKIVRFLFCHLVQHCDYTSLNLGNNFLMNLFHWTCKF